MNDTKKTAENEVKTATDTMTPISFEKMLHSLLKEYRTKKCFYEVPVSRNKSKEYRNYIGPAAGPHTQLAGNLVAGYAAGASYFELKTVQIMTGEELGIKKPCIYAATEVFNTEWSTELSIEAAKSEYIKGYLLLKILIQEFELGDPEGFEFVMSAGYDLNGIKSPVIDDFLESMKEAAASKEWQKDMAYLKENLSMFTNLTKEYLDSIPSCITDTIALSTMHGCKREEIEKIAEYLLCEKQLNVYVKMNPTLLGREGVRKALDSLGYSHLHFDPHSFEVDIDFESACEMLGRLQKTAKSLGKRFGVKVTNTLPVTIQRKELLGDTMYLSGPALFPIAIGVAKKLAKRFDGTLPLSYSGGADQKNCKDILECGIYPVTVSSYLLKPAGYKNLKALAAAADLAVIPELIDAEKCGMLEAQAGTQASYQYKAIRTYAGSEDYSVLCAACHNCVDICPNRANKRITIDGEAAVIHLDSLCNECGACRYYCIKGHVPYKEKLTLFTTKEAYEATTNPGIYIGTEENREAMDIIAAEKKIELQEMDSTTAEKKIELQEMDSTTARKKNSVPKIRNIGRKSIEDSLEKEFGNEAEKIRKINWEEYADEF